MARLSKNTQIGLGVVAMLVIGTAFAFPPVTRNVVATNDLCSFCHVAQEYKAEVRLTYSKPHPAPNEEKPDQAQVRCVECHLPPGIVNTVYAWTHFASLTDLFGHFRRRTIERSGEWLPPRQVAAYRVRARLFEYDSSTCRTCHVESEIKPKRERGVNAHKKALDENKTCIECHYNEKHRRVDVRDDEFGTGEKETS